MPQSHINILIPSEGGRPPYRLKRRFAQRQEQKRKKDEKVSVLRGPQRPVADPGQDVLGEQRPHRDPSQHPAAVQRLGPAVGRGGGGGGGQTGAGLHATLRRLPAVPPAAGVEQRVPGALHAQGEDPGGDRPSEEPVPGETRERARHL